MAVRRGSKQAPRSISPLRGRGAATYTKIKTPGGTRKRYTFRVDPTKKAEAKAPAKKRKVRRLKGV